MMKNSTPMMAMEPAWRLAVAGLVLVTAFMARIPLLGDGRADDESGRPDGWQLGITLSYFFV
jgi:hypothetical protein